MGRARGSYPRSRGFKSLRRYQITRLCGHTLRGAGPVLLVTNGGHSGGGGRLSRLRGCLVGRISNEDIEWLVALATREELLEIEVSDGENSILVRRVAHSLPAPCETKLPSAPPQKKTHPPAESLVAVRAPMSGVFYRSPAPDSPPFVDVGDDVQAGETVALVEAMKLYNDVPAPCSGRVENILVADGDHVEAEQELLLIRPFGE